MIAVGAIVAKGFISGLMDGVKSALEDTESSVKELDNMVDDYNKAKLFGESAEEISKDEIDEDMERLEVLNLYARYAAEMDSDLVNVTKEIIEEMETVVDEAFDVVKKSIEAEDDID